MNQNAEVVNMHTMCIFMDRAHLAMLTLKLAPYKVAFNLETLN